MMKRNSFDIRSLAMLIDQHSLAREPRRNPTARQQIFGHAPGGERHTQPVTIAKRISRGKPRVGYSERLLLHPCGVVVTNIINSKILNSYSIESIQELLPISAMCYL